ncbi:MAG: hypothetical protein AAGF93_08990 [Cyanobacteria bacterium P01_H01_bin.105]
MITTVASPLTHNQTISLADRAELRPSPWRLLVVKVALQPFLWAAWVKSKVILREDW